MRLKFLDLGLKKWARNESILRGESQSPADFQWGTILVIFGGILDPKMSQNDPFLGLLIKFRGYISGFEENLEDESLFSQK